MDSGPLGAGGGTEAAHTVPRLGPFSLSLRGWLRAQWGFCSGTGPFLGQPTTSPSLLPISMVGSLGGLGILFQEFWGDCW